jgi:hypothetical protein
MRRLTPCRNCGAPIGSYQKSLCKNCGVHYSKSFNRARSGFLALLEVQEHRCALCGIQFDNARKSTKPHVDHNHETRLVRGLLCLGCNVGLGYFKDNIAVLQKAIEYLKKSESNNTATINNSSNAVN